MVAMIGPSGPIVFYFPTTEFPTEVSCQAEALQVRRAFSSDANDVRTACWFHFVPLP